MCTECDAISKIYTSLVNNDIVVNNVSKLDLHAFAIVHEKQ